MRLRHIIIYFSLLFLFAHVKIPTGNMGTIPGIGGIGIAHARGGDSGSGGSSGDGGHGGGSGSGGGAGDGGHGGGSGSGGGSGDGGHGGDSGSSGGSGDGGHGGDSGPGGGGDGDGGHDDGGHDSGHDASHEADHDDVAHHDTAHTPQDHPDTVDSSHHVDSPVDHHDEASHIFAPQPPAVATPSITDPASTGSGDPFQPGILLAVNAKPSDLEAAWAMGLSVDQVVSLDHLGIVITRFRLPRGARTLNSLRNLIKRKSDLPYDLNHYYRIASSSPADDARSYPRRLIGWSLPANGPVPAARIGMVDTFINPRITALKRQKITTRSFVAGKKKTSGSHGTRIASILVGAPDSDFPGLMPQARIYAADAFSIGRSGRYHASALAIARALNWLAAQKVDVINLSLAGPDNRLLKLAVARTLASPIPIVAAAGNQGPTAAPAFPAAYEKVIAVTAVDRFNRIYRQANQGVYIDFAAPGIRIWLPGKTGKGRYCTGTSYASAYGTAMAATVWTRPDTDKRIDTLVRLLRKNALDLGPPGRDPVFGWGLIHCGTAATR